MNISYDALRKVNKAMQCEIDAPVKFLEAWKKGINKVGHDFFNIASTVDQAKSKNDLEPNYNFIKESIGGYSHGTQVLLGLMYSFFDSVEGQKLLEQVQAPNFVDGLAILDWEGQEIFADLCANYTGW